MTKFSQFQHTGHHQHQWKYSGPFTVTFSDFPSLEAFCCSLFSRKHIFISQKRYLILIQYFVVHHACF